MKDLARLKELEQENAKLNACTPSRAGECGDQRRPEPKVVTPSAKREAVEILAGTHGLSVRGACRLVRLARAAYYRPPTERVLHDAPVIDALQAVVAVNSRWGFWKCFDRLRNTGHAWNHKRVHRVTARSASICRGARGVGVRSGCRIPWRRQPSSITSGRSTS